MPVAGLIRDGAGNLYSTTSQGGTNNVGKGGGGTVFKLLASAGEAATITLTSSLNPSFVNQSVTFLVVVSGSGSTPTGSVTFEQGSTVLGTETLVNGQASFTVTIKKSGNVSIVASYSGDQNYKAANSSPLTQVVDKPFTTSTALASSLNPSTYGQAVGFWTGHCEFGRTDPDGNGDVQEWERFARERDPQRRCGQNYNVETSHWDFDANGHSRWKHGECKKRVIGSDPSRKSGEFENVDRVFGEPL